MHTLARYDYSYKELEDHGLDNVYLYHNQSKDGGQKSDLILAKTIEGLSNFVGEYKPDMIVIHGDRGEALAGAIVGVLNGVIVSHIEGGEISGTVDELLRHSVSKLSDYHFVANQEAANRLLQMGESEESIHVIGSPEVEVMISNELPDLNKVKKRYDIKFDNYGVFCYHPVGPDLQALDNDVSEIIHALCASGKNYIVIYPNNDYGSEIILSQLLNLKENRRFRIFNSIRFEYFLQIVKNANFVIGNSSAGVREAPVFGIPVINIGDRQQNRHRGKMITNVNPKKSEIERAIEQLPMSTVREFNFGGGGSSRLFLTELSKEKIWIKKKLKQFIDRDLTKTHSD
jgi:UDP-N-acetylglucosamine 2-epimerase (hydrolysing)